MTEDGDMAVEAMNGSTEGQEDGNIANDALAVDASEQDAVNTPAAESSPVTRRIVKLTEETINRIAAGEVSAGQARSTWSPQSLRATVYLTSGCPTPCFSSQRATRELDRRRQQEHQGHSEGRWIEAAEHTGHRQWYQGE